MRRRVTALGLALAIVLAVLPMGALAAYSLPSSFEAPQSVAVSFKGNAFTFAHTASAGVRLAVDAREAGEFSPGALMYVGVQWDYQLDGNGWHHTSEWDNGECPTTALADYTAEGGYVDTFDAFPYEMPDLFSAQSIPAGYFDSHTLSFRLRYIVMYAENMEDSATLSPWAAVLTYPTDANGEGGNEFSPSSMIQHAPELKTVTLNASGTLFEGTLAAPNSQITSLNTATAQNAKGGVKTNVWIKVGNNPWTDAGNFSALSGAVSFGAPDGMVPSDPVFQVKARYVFDQAGNPEGGQTGLIYSPFSNVLTRGVSTWAAGWLEKAETAELIPAIIKNTNMQKQITREEFCEMAVVLYEKVTGKQATPISPNPFTDTSNVNILKASALSITAGTSETTFSPKTLINREQCAVMLYNTLQAIAPAGSFNTAGAKDFPDQSKISDWAVVAAKYMSKLKIIAGDSAGNFMPKASTPAEIAANYGMASREAAVIMVTKCFEMKESIGK